MSLKDLTYKPRQKSVKVILDDTVREELEAAQAALIVGRREDTKAEALASDVPRLEKAVEDAKTAADKAAVLFTFKALPRWRIAELIAQCPPTSTQLDRWKDALRAAPLVNRSAPAFDDDKFTPLLLGASMVEPATSESEVMEMWGSGEWSDAIWIELWNTAWKVNEEVSTRPI